MWPLRQYHPLRLRQDNPEHELRSGLNLGFGPARV